MVFEGRKTGFWGSNRGFCPSQMAFLFLPKIAPKDRKHAILLGNLKNVARATFKSAPKNARIFANINFSKKVFPKNVIVEEISVLILLARLRIKLFLGKRRYRNFCHAEKLEFQKMGGQRLFCNKSCHET